MSSVFRTQSTDTIIRPYIHKIYGRDRLGMVGYNDRASVIAEPVELYDSRLQSQSQTLHRKVGGSGTNLTDGLRKSVEMLLRTPKGVLRRIWLLTDGYPNREVGSIMSTVRDARQAYINVNTIGFGDEYDEGLLRRISGATHNGKFVPVKTLRQLTDALVLGSNGNPNRRRHRSETTVLAIDLSPSMTMPMEGKTKIAVVEEAILHLLHYKQQCFA